MSIERTIFHKKRRGVSLRSVGAYPPACMPHGQEAGEDRGRPPPTLWRATTRQGRQVSGIRCQD